MKEFRFQPAIAKTLVLLAGLAACTSPQETETEPATEGPRSGEPAKISVASATGVQSVNNRHVLVATVMDAQGRPVPGAHVEWMLASGGTGAFMEYDQTSSHSGKASGMYAMTSTGGDAYSLNMGTASAADDVQLKPGQTWVAVSSPVEGTAHVMAVSPDVAAWGSRQASAAVQWRDAAIKVSDGASGRLGATYPVTVTVMRQSDGAPLPGHLVDFVFEEGENALLDPGARKALQVTTGADGTATATVRQATAKADTADLDIHVTRPENEKCCLPAVRLGTVERPYAWLAPSIDIEKSGPPTAVVGENFVYDLTVRNASNVSCRETVVTDPLPDGLAYVSSTPAAQVSGQNLTWSLGELGAGETRGIKVTVKGTRVGRFNNCARVAAEGGSLTDQDCAETVISAPALQLTKSAPAEVLVCDPIRYRYVVTNTGDAVARAVRVEDKLPNGLTAAGGATTVAFDAGDLQPGQSREFTADVKASRAGAYANVATAASGGLTVDARANTVVRQPVLAITKEGPDNRFIGRPVTYTVTVVNNGDGVARNTMVRDRLPADCEFRSASEGGRQEAGAVVWSLGDLAPRQSKEVSLTVMPVRQGTLLNEAVAEAYCAGAVTSTARTEVSGIPAILLEVVDLEDPLEVGSNTTYVITVTNQGSANGTNIVVKAVVPAEMSYVSGTGPTRVSATGANVGFEPLPTLAPGARAEFRITVKATAPKDVRFQVSMTSAQSTVPVEETESTNIYQ